MAASSRTTTIALAIMIAAGLTCSSLLQAQEHEEGEPDSRDEQEKLNTEMAPSDAPRFFDPWEIEENPAYWPRQVMLRVGMAFPGFNLADRELIDVADIRGNEVFFERNGKLFAVRFDDTDIISRAWDVYRSPTKHRTVTHTAQIASDPLLWPEMVRLVNPVAFGNGPDGFTLQAGTELSFGRVKDEQIVSLHSEQTIMFSIHASNLMEHAINRLQELASLDRHAEIRSELRTDTWFLFRNGEFVPYPMADQSDADVFLILFFDGTQSTDLISRLSTMIQNHIASLRDQGLRIETVQVSRDTDYPRYLRQLAARSPVWPVMLHESGFTNRLLNQFTFQRNFPGIVWLRGDGTLIDQEFGIRTPDDLEFAIMRNQNVLAK